MDPPELSAGAKTTAEESDKSKLKAKRKRFELSTNDTVDNSENVIAENSWKIKEAEEAVHRKECQFGEELCTLLCRCHAAGTKDCDLTANDLHILSCLLQAKSSDMCHPSTGSDPLGTTVENLTHSNTYRVFIVFVGSHCSEYDNLCGAGRIECDSESFVDVRYCSNLDDALNFVSTNQTTNSECNRLRKSSELKYADSDVLRGLDDSVSSAIIKTDFNTIASDNKVKLNRKMRRLLAGKTRPCAESEISTCIGSKREESNNNSNFRSSVLKCYEHYVLLCPASAHSGSGANFPLKNSHDIQIVPKTIYHNPVVHVEYLSSLHITTIPRCGQSANDLVSPVQVDATVNSGLKIWSEKNKKKKLHVILDISNIHFSLHKSYSEYSSDKPIPHRNDFITCEGSNCFLIMSSTSYFHSCRQGSRTLASLGGSESNSRVTGKKSSSRSTKYSMKLISGLKGCSLNLMNVILSELSVESAVHVSGKSIANMYGCRISNVDNGCGIKCESGSGVNINCSSIINCSTSGIFANNAGCVNITECIMDNNGRCGVEIFSCQGNNQLSEEDKKTTATESTMLKCPKVGVSILQTKICGNSSGGILLINCTASTIMNTIIAGNGLANVSASKGTTCRLYQCSIFDSSRSGIYARDYGTSLEVVEGELYNNNDSNIETDAEAKVAYVPVVIAMK